jgi:hypothetical protein
VTLFLVVVASTTSLVGVEAAGARRRHPAPPPPPPPSNWQLVDYQQQACFSANVHDTYFGIWINGTWNTAVDVGAAGLPAGGVFDTSYAPIPPGSSTGIYSLAYVHVSFATPPPIGVYTASIWASDGSTTQSVPVTLNVVDRCGY